MISYLSVHGLQQLLRPTGVASAVWIASFALSTAALLYQLYCAIQMVLAEPIQTQIQAFINS